MPQPFGHRSSCCKGCCAAPLFAAVPACSRATACICCRACRTPSWPACLRVSVQAKDRKQTLPGRSCWFVRDAHARSSCARCFAASRVGRAAGGSPLAIRTLTLPVAAAEYGLYGAFVPCIAYALLGSSRQLVSMLCSVRHEIACVTAALPGPWRRCAPCSSPCGAPLEACAPAVAHMGKTGLQPTDPQHQTLLPAGGGPCGGDVHPAWQRAGQRVLRSKGPGRCQHSARCWNGLSECHSTACILLGNGLASVFPDQEQVGGSPL